MEGKCCPQRLFKRLTGTCHHAFPQMVDIPRTRYARARMDGYSVQGASGSGEHFASTSIRPGRGHQRAEKKGWLAPPWILIMRGPPSGTRRLCLGMREFLVKFVLPHTGAAARHHKERRSVKAGGHAMMPRPKSLRTNCNRMPDEQGRVCRGMVMDCGSRDWAELRARRAQGCAPPPGKGSNGPAPRPRSSHHQELEP